MKIALTVDPEIPVPPLHYGGIERIVAMLIDEYILLGHQVTVFAHENSTTKANLISYPGQSSQSKVDTFRNMQTISAKIYKGNFDILHSFSRLAYMSFILPFKLPKIMSYQRKPTPSQIRLAQKIAYKNSLYFTGCSDFIRDQISPYGDAITVYNGFPDNTYSLSATVEKDAPLVFLGRLEPVKGPHTAIEIAMRSGKKLIIAGNIPAEYQSYFNNKIAPFIDDRQIFFIGPVNDKEKAELLKNAYAFLMPIEWDEPFGIVMAEAMACGTPVIALAHGAATEIITQGVTGYLCESVDECVQKVSIADQLDRRLIHEMAIERFSAKVIAQNYLQLYRERMSEN